MSRVIIVLGLVCAAFAIIVIALSLHLNLFGKSKVSDEDLLALFSSHRNEFERLRDMTISDAGPLSCITVEDLSGLPISADRQHEYRRLMDSIMTGLTIGIDRDEVFFHIAAGGFFSGGNWTEGIAYLRPIIENRCIVVSSLKELHPNSKEGVYIVPIAPSWFLIYARIS